MERSINQNYSMSPVLDENTSILTCAGNICINLIDDSLQVNAEEISIGLPSSSDVSHTLNISASKLLDTSLCPTPGYRTGVNLRSRTRQGNNQNNKSLNSECDQAKTLKRNPVGNGKTDTSKSDDELQDDICGSRNNGFEAPLETSVETDNSLFTVQKVSGFRSRAINAKKLSSEICTLSTNISKRVSSVNSKNPFESALASDSSDESILKSLELSGSGGRSGVIQDKKRSGFRSRAMNVKKRSGEMCNLSTDISKRVPSVNSKNPFESALASDSSDESILKSLELSGSGGRPGVNQDKKLSGFRSRAMNAKKRSGEMCNLSTNISKQVPSVNSKNPFESAFASDSSNTSVSKSLELSISGSASRPDVRKRGFQSRLRSSQRKGFKKDCDGFISPNISTDVENSLDADKKDIHGSHRQKKIKTVSGYKNNVFEAAFETSVETDISDFNPKRSRFSECRKNPNNEALQNPFEHVFDSTTDTSDAPLFSNVENNASASQSGGSKIILNKCNEGNVNSEGNNIANTEAVARASDKLAQNADAEQLISEETNKNEIESKSLSQPSAVLHIESDDSMLFSSESDISDDEIENSVGPNANDRESSIDPTEDDRRSSRYDSMTRNDVSQRTPHSSLNKLSVICSNNHSQSLMNDVSAPNESNLSTSMANRIVRVNENFDSMELTGNSISIEPIEITNVTFNKNISVKIGVENRSLKLSPLKSQNVIAIVDNNIENENLNKTDKSISVNKIIETTDISMSKVSPRLASLRKQTPKGPVDKINNENSLPYADNSSSRSLNNSSSEKSNSRKSQNKEDSQHSSLRNITNRSTSLASLRKRLSKDSQDKSKNKENSPSKLSAKGSLDKEESQLSIIRSSPRIRASKDSQDKSNTGTSRNSINLDGIMNSSCNRVSLRKRTLLASHAKSNLENSLHSSSPEVMDNSFNEISTASDDKSNKSRELKRNYSDKSESAYGAASLDASNNTSIISAEFPLSELRNNYRKTENNLKKDCEAIERILTFPSSSKVSNSKLKNTTHSKSDRSKVLHNKNDETLSKCKTPKLKKPKNWVTNDFYKFIIKKLEPKYHQKSRRRAERFVEFLVDKVFVVNHTSVKDQYKKLVDVLILEMAKLQLVETYFEFYYFVQTYLPNSFRMKSVPTLTPFNHEPLVDNLPPEKLFASIL